MLPNKPAILFLASWYPSPLNLSHGIFIKNHAIALSKYNPVVVIYSYSSSSATGFKLTKNKQTNFEEWLVEYKKVKSIPLLSSIIKYYRFKKAYKILLKELIASNIAIKAIQINSIFPVAVVLPLFKNYFKVPHAIVEHWSGYLPEDGNYKGYIQKKITNYTVKQAAKIYYVSDKQKQAMLNHGLNGNYELLYNVVDINIFKENKIQKSEKPLLLHVSSLVQKEKNIFGTLNVIKKLQNAIYEFDFVIVGGDEDTIYDTTQKIQQLNIINTICVGTQSQQSVASFMQKAHALILFSNYEGMPVVILEALATGLPVFASNVGQLPNIITSDFGELVTIGNETELEHKLKEFLDGKLTFDSQKMIDFIQKNASQQVVGKQLNDFYELLNRDK